MFFNAMKKTVFVIDIPRGMQMRSEDLGCYYEIFKKDIDMYYEMKRTLDMASIGIPLIVLLMWRLTNIILRKSRRQNAFKQKPGSDKCIKEENRTDPVKEKTDDSLKQHSQKIPVKNEIARATVTRTWNKNDAVKLAVEKAGAPSRRPESVPSFFKNSVEKYENVNALCFKNDNEWTGVTYKEYYEDVRNLAKAFITFGLEPLDTVCIMGFNSREWATANFAAIFAGGISAGFHARYGTEECLKVALDCNAAIFVVDGSKQLEKILEIKEHLHNLKAIIQYNGENANQDDLIYNWEDAMDIGLKECSNKLDERLENIKINQCCTLVYTSGTTGDSKGVMLSHDNLTWATYCTELKVLQAMEGERVVSYLPLSHIAALLTDLYAVMFVGGTCYFADRDWVKGTLRETILHARPTTFFGVPKVWEMMYEEIKLKENQVSVGQKWLLSWAKKKGDEALMRRHEKGDAKLNFLARIILKKVKNQMGLDDCNTFLSAGAPIRDEILKYFHSLDIKITNAYGLSESTGPHTLCVDNLFKIGSVGKACFGYYVKIDNSDTESQGEVLLKGRNIAMGYLNKQEATIKDFSEDGWLRTGDIGELDHEFFLFITGRLKEIIITTGGENVAPGPIEDNIKSELPCISNCMVVGDKRPFLACLLTFKTIVNNDTLEPSDDLTPAAVAWCRSVASEANTIQDILRGPDEKVMEAIRLGIARANKLAVAGTCAIRDFKIIPKDFSVPGGELTLTMKLKRRVIIEKYSEEIEEIYDGFVEGFKKN